MTITRELLNELLSGVENANDFLGDKGLMKGVSETLCMRLSPCRFDGSFVEPFWV